MKVLGPLLAIAAAAGTGCITYERGSFAAVSTTMVPVEAVVVAETAEGAACGDLFRDPFRRAVDDAIGKSAGANALVDVTVHFERLCMVVRGKAVRVP